MSPPLLIRGATLATPAGMRTNEDLLIEDGVIAAIAPRLERAAALRLDAENLIVASGFIDIHVHGVAGVLFENGTAAACERISRMLARYGTTGILATLAALPPERLQEAVSTIAAFCGREDGARILGIHLEGPFLNPERCGAQNPDWMRPPSVAEVDALQRLSRGLIRMVTVAPELEGALSFIRALRERAITVAIGHTDATEAQMQAAIEAGAGHVTHAYNAMRPLHHREPGAVGVALSEDALSIELICDGHHVSPRAVDIALRCKPPERVALVSDAVMAGVDDGEYELLGSRCIVHDGVVRTQGGQLAGSCLTLDQAVRNLHAWQPALALPNVFQLASAVPARVIGIAQSHGRIARGNRADLVLLTQSLQPVATLCAGEIVHAEPSVVALSS